MAVPTTVNVAICTWNRAAILDQVLARMEKLVIPDGVEWEILVVNNNSPDHTDDVIQKYAATLPVRRLFEPKQGSSNARNCATAAARGDLLIWIDDDVLVDRDWLKAYCEAAALWPEAVFFGGVVEPWFVEPPPPSLQKHLPQLGKAFATVNFGPDVRPLGPKEDVFSANLAIRTGVLKQFRFDTRLGRVKTGLVGDDESKLLDELQAAGHRGVWVGNARVQHYMPPERATWNYIWRYYQGIGHSSTRRNGILACPTILGLPRWMVRQYFAERVRSLVGRPLRSAEWLGHYTRAAFFSGCLAECREYARANPAKSGRAAALAQYLVEPLHDAPVSPPVVIQNEFAEHGSGFPA